MEGLGCINSSLGNFVKPYRVKSRGASKKAKSRSASEKAKSRGTSKNRPTLMFLVSTTAFLTVFMGIENLTALKTVYADGF